MRPLLRSYKGRTIPVMPPRKPKRTKQEVAHFRANRCSGPSCLPSGDVGHGCGNQYEIARWQCIAREGNISPRLIPP